jgi:hypothetical protein
VHGDGTRRNENKSQDGIFEGIRFGPETDLSPVGDRRRWFAVSTIGGAQVEKSLLTKGGNVHQLVVMIGAS